MPSHKLPIPERPDTERVLACARALIAQIRDHGISDDTVMATIDKILFGKKDAWECARAGLLTEDETANLLLAHLDTMVEQACGRGFHREAFALENTAAMKRALFGRQWLLTTSAAADQPAARDVGSLHRRIMTSPTPGLATGRPGIAEATRQPERSARIRSRAAA